MQTRATLGLTAGALVVGLLAGLALGDGSDKETKSSGPGPTKTVAGVPVGYARSQEGAVTAAAAYAQSIGALALASTEDRNAALVAMTDPQALSQIRQGLEPGLETLAKGLAGSTSQDVVIRSAPVGYRVETYSNDAAEIYLWAVGVLGNSTSAPPSASWGTTKVIVRWVGGDWKLSANVERLAGPTPQSSGTPSTPQDFVTSIRDFRSFNNAPAG
jgi:hypothetical protein